MDTALRTQTVRQSSANLWENEAASFYYMQIGGLAWEPLGELSFSLCCPTVSKQFCSSLPGKDKPLNVCKGAV